MQELASQIDTSAETYLRSLRQQVPAIANVLAERIPIFAESPLKIGDLPTDYAPDATDAYRLMRYIYEFALTKANLPAPEGYKSWAEFNWQMVQTYDNDLTFSYVKPILKLNAIFPDETKPCIYKDSTIGLFSAAGEDWPYFLLYNDPAWDNDKERDNLVRVYLTFDQAMYPSNLGNSLVVFARLCYLLHQKDIKFNSKLTSGSGTANRTDNIILYADATQVDTIRDVLKEFIQEKNTKLSPTDRVLTAIPDQDLTGVAWAAEANEAQIALYQQVTSKSNPSYSEIVAMFALPNFIVRLIDAHEAQNDHEEAMRLRKMLVDINIAFEQAIY